MLDTCMGLGATFHPMKKAMYTDEDIARMANAAVSDPRTVLRYLAGLPVRGKVAERIQAVVDADPARKKATR
jgi:hypothetical protein